MPHSWESYFAHYTDWDDSHCFNVRIELGYEDQIKNLGYIEKLTSDDLFLAEDNHHNQSLPKSKTYIKNKNELVLSFAVPYDWSIDTDWEDKALVLLGINDEWVIDSSVEDK